MDLAYCYGKFPDLVSRKQKKICEIFSNNAQFLYEKSNY